jgi:hypothetical protein
MPERRIPPAGDPFYAAGRRTEAELIKAIAEEKARLGRSMSQREREVFARSFFAEEYRGEIRLLAAMGLLDAEDE